MFGIKGYVWGVVWRNTSMHTMKDYGGRGSLFAAQRSGLDYNVVRLSLVYIKHHI
jgi:hypothetical protein